MRKRLDCDERTIKGHVSRRQVMAIIPLRCQVLLGVKMKDIRLKRKERSIKEKKTKMAIMPLRRNGLLGLKERVRSRFM